MEMIGPALALAFIVKKVIDYARSVLHRDYHATVLIPLSIVVGVLGSWFLSTSEVIASQIQVLPDLVLHGADPVVIVLYGFIVGATAGAVHDLVKPTTPPHSP